MKCNIKQRNQDHTIGTLFDEGIMFGIMTVELMLHRMKGFGAQRLRKFEAAIKRKIEEGKGNARKYTEQRFSMLEQWLGVLDQDYRLIYREYNNKYRNYPDKLVKVGECCEPYDLQFHNADSNAVDDWVDAGIFQGLECGLVVANHSMQIGCPSIKALEDACFNYIIEKRKLKPKTFKEEVTNDFAEIYVNWNLRHRQHIHSDFINPITDEKGRGR